MRQYETSNPVRNFVRALCIAMFLSPLLYAQNIHIGTLYGVDETAAFDQKVLRKLVEDSLVAYKRIIQDGRPLTKDLDKKRYELSATYSSGNGYAGLVFTLSDSVTSVSYNFAQKLNFTSPSDVASALYYLVHAIVGFPLQAQSTVPQFIERLGADSFALTGNPNSYNFVYSVAVAPNGDVLIPNSQVVLQLNSDFKRIDTFGEPWISAQVYGNAYDVKSTPSGSVVTRQSVGGDLYMFSHPKDQGRRIVSGLTGIGAFIVLSDGSIVVRDLTGPRTFRIEGRKRTELNLINPSYTGAIYNMAAGPDSTILVHDPVQKSISTYTKDGQKLEMFIPLMNDTRLGGVRTLYGYPDGSIVFAGTDFIARVDRNGVPYWILEQSQLPSYVNLQYVSSLAFDPKNGFLYSTDAFGKQVIQLVDVAYCRSQNIPVPDRRELITINSKLVTDPENTELLFAKSEYYLKRDARHIAIGILKDIMAFDPGDFEAEEQLKALQSSEYLIAADTSRDRAMETIRTIGTETARSEYTRALSLYEQSIALDPGNTRALRNRQELVQTMRRAEAGQELPTVPPLTIVSAKLENLFPALITSYRDKTIGTVRIKNEGTTPLNQIKVSLMIPRFMDFPVETAVSQPLEPGKELEIDVKTALNTEVLSIEEDLPIQAQVSIFWDQNGQRNSVQRTVQTTLYRRTALTWDETEKLVSFITPNEETISSFSLRVLEQIQETPQSASGTSTGTTPGASQTSLALFERFSSRIKRAAAIADALGVYRIAYLEDPSSPISQILGKPQTIDTVRFPRTTLYYRSGDCDDTTALLASLYEAAGIRTAVVTSPGHVFLAFDTEEPAENAWMFSDPGGVLILENTVWIPVESTDLSSGFLHSWRTAAELVKRNFSSGNIETSIVGKAREQFPAIPLPSSPYKITPPTKEDILSFSKTSMDSLKESIYTRNLGLLSGQASGRSKIAMLNRLGVLHARFGEVSKAKEAFDSAIKEDPRQLAAYVNMANLHIEAKQSERAIQVLTEALKLRPDSSSVQLMLAQAYYAGGNVVKAREMHLALTKVSPELAEKFGYLASGSDPTTGGQRASRTGDSFIPVWITEE